MASIRFENVSKSYGDVLAVDQVSFEVPDNAFFCFFGPPLSGKSTILKLILGLETPDSGEIFFDGRPMRDVSPPDRNVAMVFQNLALFPHMTALENVRFPLVERKIDEATIKARVAEVTDKLHMAHILHKPPAQLSGGERQRVAIARALVRDPVAYLMDDPISALDARLREETRVELRRMQQDMAKTLIYVTHDQEEAMSVSDQMLILETGRVRQIGAPHDLYDAPNSAYVASMLGAPAMNMADTADAVGALSKAPGIGRGTKTVGIRPENLKVARKDGPGRVTAIEPLGATTVLSVEAAGVSWKAALRGQPDHEIGAPVELSVDAGGLHCFDAQGNALPAA
ncbi:ABC transporter ATP-binding protein [Tateyamaria sp. SN3-11]|uniref:ABC transporter ATP-binding protein n=1 Tax=Tateyamaria sp. SN3-11 TaxID=3092147 RepID=UPI0039EA1131